MSITKSSLFSDSVLLESSTHIFFVVAVYLVQMSSVTDHWHPWPMQGQCMPEISVKIRTSLWRLNTQVHGHGNWHTVKHAYRCQGQAILLRYKRNFLYPPSLQHVIRSRGMKITHLLRWKRQFIIIKRIRLYVLRWYRSGKRSKNYTYLHLCQLGLHVFCYQLTTMNEIEREGQTLKREQWERERIFLS